LDPSPDPRLATEAPEQPTPGPGDHLVLDVVLVDPQLVDGCVKRLFDRPAGRLDPFHLPLPLLLAAAAAARLAVAARPALARRRLLGRRLLGRGLLRRRRLAAGRAAGVPVGRRAEQVPQRPQRTRSR